MLRWYTSGSAALSFDEASRGQIAPGMLADLVVVNPDPFTVQPGELSSVRVALTLVNGQVVYAG
jgi:predicted amidohydrolase YtcJ